MKSVKRFSAEKSNRKFHTILRLDYSSKIILNENLPFTKDHCEYDGGIRGDSYAN
jgi:hypothetical protein